MEEPSVQRISQGTQQVVATRERSTRQPVGPFKRWLLQGYLLEVEGPHEPEGRHHTHKWWQVMCLTGVDYFSTLGYQPGIAALAAGTLSPIATLILVLLTLLGALPVYRRVAEESPHGEGSIAMLERLLSWWTGKLMVLALLGFVATDFIITITLSAADATAHVIENPFWPASLHHHNVALTLILIGILAAVFLKGFKEAIGIAVALVFAYLALNAVVISVSLAHLFRNPVVLSDWKTSLFTSHGSPLLMIGVALIVFPKLALGMSGFETGVALMPLVEGEPGDNDDHPVGRIRRTHQLLLVAAVTMSIYLIASSLVTITLIPAAEFREGGKAAGRALAYLAHHFLGDKFGTLYDISTILILWFAGASAMAGLLNIVPRYLPRYGMAPDWTRAIRPLVIVFSVIAFIVTVIFKADVNAQGGAYATGVLVLMSSGAVAVTLAAWRSPRRKGFAAYLAIALVFIYTAIANMFERPDGLKIAAFFIIAIIAVSMLSRVLRTTELRDTRIEIDEEADRFIQADRDGEIHVIANKRQKGDALEYELKEKEQRENNHIPDKEQILFLEVSVCDASEFVGVMKVRGVQVGPYHVLRAESSAVPNAIAAFLLYLRDRTGKIPHAYFSWSEGNPIKYLISYVFLGEGDTAPLTHEVLRVAERDPEKRPALHVGGG